VQHKIEHEGPNIYIYIYIYIYIDTHTHTHREREREREEIYTGSSYNNSIFARFILINFYVCLYVLVCDYFPMCVF